MCTVWQLLVQFLSQLWLVILTDVFSSLKMHTLRKLLFRKQPHIKMFCLIWSKDIKNKWYIWVRKVYWFSTNFLFLKSVGEGKEAKTIVESTYTEWLSDFSSRPRFPWQGYYGKHMLTEIDSCMRNMDFLMTHVAARITKLIYLLSFLCKKNLFLKIQIQLTYNIMLVSGVQHNDLTNTCIEFQREKKT